MIKRIRTWLGERPHRGTGTPVQAAEKPRAHSTWVLSVKPPMGPRPQVEGGVYEWGLTAIGTDRERACRITGIWFWVSREKTLQAHKTINAMSKTKALTRAELCALIDDHRVPGSRIHLQRRIANVERTDDFAGAADEGFLEALGWDGIE